MASEWRLRALKAAARWQSHVCGETEWRLRGVTPESVEQAEAIRSRGAGGSSHI